MATDKEFENSLADQDRPQILPDTPLPLVIHTNKLDADQYSAEDLDGVTESVFGSGNLAYASLQASQTNSLLNSNSMQSHLGMDTIGTNTDRPDGQISQVSLGGEGGGGYSAATVGALGGAKLFADSGIFQQSGSGLNLSSNSFNDNGATSYRGPLSSSNTNGGNNNGGSNFNDVGGNSFQDTSNVSNNDNSQVTNIINNNNTTNIINTEEVVNLIEQVLNELGDTITNVNVFLGDVIETILQINITEIITEVITQVTSLIEIIVQQVFNTLEIVTNITQDILQFIDNSVVNFITELLTSIELNCLLDLSVAVEIVQNTVTNLIEVIHNIVGDTIGDTLTQIICDLDEYISSLCITVDQTLEMVTNLLNGGGGDGDGDIGLNTDISLAILNNPLDALDDLDVSETVGAVTDTVDNVVAPVQDILDNLGLGIVDVAGTVGTVTDIVDPLLDVVDEVVDTTLDPVLDLAAPVLDPVLDIVDTAVLDTVIGTVDEALDISTNILLDPVEDLIGDLDIDLGLGLDLLGGSGNEISNGAGDSDITLATQIDLIDNTLGLGNIDISLDPIEAITGDIDLDLGLALNLLGDIAAPLVNDQPGGTGEDTLFAHLGDVLTDVAGNLVTPIIGDTLVDLNLGLDLLQPQGSTGEGTDILADIGAVLGDIGIINEPDLGLDVDPVEAILGNLDLDLTAAIDLLGDVTGGGGETPSLLPEGLLGNIGGDVIGDLLGGVENALGGGGMEWTENLIGGDTPLFGDLVGGSGLNDILPDPVGTIAEGLGALNIVPNLDLGGLGGLFG